MYMSYIPKEHLKYDILPNSRTGNWEVVSYDSDMIRELIDIVDISYPYHLSTLEEYYKEIDSCIDKYPQYRDKLIEYKNDLIIRNDKSNWGIVRYIGESNDHFTKNRCYYVPMVKKNNEYTIDGIIDDEEYTSYIAWSMDDTSKDKKLEFEIVIDPSNKLDEYLMEM